MLLLLNQVNPNLLGELKKNAVKKEPQPAQKTNEGESQSNNNDIPIKNSEPLEFMSKFDEIQKNLELKKQNLNSKIENEKEDSDMLIKPEEKPVQEKKVISLEEYKASLKKKAEPAKNPAQQESKNILIINFKCIDEMLL